MCCIPDGGHAVCACMHAWHAIHAFGGHTANQSPTAIGLHAGCGSRQVPGCARTRAAGNRAAWRLSRPQGPRERHARVVGGGLSLRAGRSVRTVRASLSQHTWLISAASVTGAAAGGWPAATCAAAVMIVMACAAACCCSCCCQGSRGRATGTGGGCGKGATTCSGCGCGCSCAPGHATCGAPTTPVAPPEYSGTAGAWPGPGRGPPGWAPAARPGPLCSCCWACVNARAPPPAAPRCPVLG